jgi:N-acetylglucosamine kinase-like BadF-type ATPase
VTDAALAIDAGQTGMKIRMTAPGAEPRESTLPGVRTDQELIPQLAAAAREAAAGTRIAEVSAGVSGLTRRESDATALLDATQDLGTRVARLTHDSVTSFLGTLGGDRGAVVAAGTGVVTLAVGRSRVARVDGWGNIMGDAGSAYWIGREALDAGMRAYDGRGPRTPLTDVMRERWPDLDEAYIDLQADPDRIRIVASFARAVSDLAGADPVAERICLRAAEELAHAVTAGLDRVAEAGDGTGDGDGSWAVGAVGGVFASGFIRSRFEQLLADGSVAVHLVSARGTGLDGAAALPDLGTEHPLRALVSVASR